MLPSGPCQSRSRVCVLRMDRPSEGPLRSEGRQESQLLLKEAAVGSDGTGDVQHAAHGSASIEPIGG